MATGLNIDEESEDLWEISDGILDNFNEENVLKHISEKDHLRTDKHTGFDNNSGDTWIYPTNYPVRKYQYDIVHNALFKNTLVCLPTGLGKTFIAAVVMYNFYRWYPQGKLIFMAPTKPLVAQQIDACYQIMGISKEDTAEITGQQKKENRLKQWKLKRVFYATPQSVVSDIDDPNFPIQSIKLVVIDEAHKAKKKYAYCEVIRMIKEQNEMFRVLALSATPGRTANDVAEVVHNLWISHIEVRTEKCPDVVPYVHKKQIETIVVRLSDKIQTYRKELIGIIDPYVQNLLKFDVIAGSTENLNRGWLVVQKQKYFNSSLVQTHPHHSAVLTDFACCISLYHALELLERHGLWTFVNYFDSSEEKFIVAKDYRLKQLLVTVRNDIGSYPFANGVTDVVLPPDFDFGHPKYDELHKCLSKHLTSNSDSQAIVFCEFRDSAFLIHQMLLQKGADIIKPAIFIGQGSSTGQKGITQKQQIATMADFRKGTYNVLTATCVAEEGIDCGEVDLIVCFDVTSKNPTRLVQRMGRTGRKRNGKVCLLVTEGKEQQNLKESMTARDYTNKKLAAHSEVVNSLCSSPRLVPTEFNPKCVETFIQTCAENISKDTTTTKRNDERVVPVKRQPVQPPSTSTTGLLKFFQPITNEPTVHRTLRKDSFLPSIQPSAESTENLNDRLKLPTFWEVIDDENASCALKLFAIKRNVSAWKDKFVKRTLPTVYEAAISNTINDAACIKKLINGTESRKRTRLSIPELSSCKEPYDPAFSAKLNERFIRMRKMQKLMENSDTSLTNESISQANDTLQMDVSAGLSQAFIPFYNEIESKYEEAHVANETKMFDCNSPLAVQKRIPLKSSTPFTSKKNSNRSVPSIKDSPLARAFEKCKSLNESKNKSKRNRKQSSLVEALAFLGLNDVMDIFDDSVEGNEIRANSFAAKEETQVPSNSDQSAVNKGIEVPSTSVLQPDRTTSQGYTVSQILQIVNSSQKYPNGSGNNKSSVKEIHIGTIDEIFGCDDDIQIDKTLSNEKQSAIEEYDDGEEVDVIASSQPVISEIKFLSKLVSSTGNKITQPTEQASSGDDMFASFAKVSSPNPSSPLVQAAARNINATVNNNNNFKSPSPNNSTSNTVDRSPSVFQRKINLSRLKALALKSNSECLPTTTLKNKSPLFRSCQSLDVKVSQQNNAQDSTLIADNGSQMDEIFKIHRNPNKRNRVINDTIFDESLSKKSKRTSKSNEAIFKKPKKLQRCNFIDDECDVSDDCSDDEHDISSDADLNSIICNEEVHDATSVDMRAIYLQSVKSPHRKNGYRMPNPNAYLHNTNIFSQAVIEDDESDYDTSFVVDECSEDEQNEHEMSVLERAEWLLKMKRREKRKKCNNNSNTVAKRRKIIELDDSSDENI